MHVFMAFFFLRLPFRRKPEKFSGLRRIFYVKIVDNLKTEYYNYHGIPTNQVGIKKGLSKQTNEIVLKNALRRADSHRSRREKRNVFGEGT